MVFLGMGNFILKSVMLSDYTTINLGGRCRYFAECNSDDDIREALEFAKKSSLRIKVLGGGSNIIFSDSGFEGIILHIKLKGIEFKNGLFTVRAGENWDDFVLYAINKAYSSIECLSGIPGNTGSTPIQNVGAYGQEVSEVIDNVRAINLATLEYEEFGNSMCGFSYRNSRFKNKDKGKYIITDVTFNLPFNNPPEIRYKELEEILSANELYKSVKNNISKIILTREAVLKIRAGKSMIYDKSDPDSISCGSFFMNPLLSKKNFELFLSKCNEHGIKPKYFELGEKYKIPAAWLIENSGFIKGYTEDGIGISSRHTLALVNRGGTTGTLLRFSEKITDRVFMKFGVKLEQEPEMVRDSV